MNVMGSILAIKKKKNHLTHITLGCANLCLQLNTVLNANSCNTYNDLSDEFLKDRIVCGTNNGVVREQLLSIQDLNLDKCLDTCRAAEISKNKGKL